MTARFSWLARAALLLLAMFAAAPWLRADTALPPKPDRYFIDADGVVDATAWPKINEQLAQFERDTSNQIIVAIYPSLPQGEDLAQYCIRLANSWGVGQAGASHGATKGDNGAVLFVFINDHKMFIATGRGLEGALPDITCKQIIENDIRPHFQEQDFTGGVEAGINAMIAATKGEYHGTGLTHQEQQGNSASSGNVPPWVVILIVVFILILVVARSSRFGPYMFTGSGFGGGWGGGGFGGGGGFSGGGGGGGGFSGFSGGGGSFGGGGAGGSW